MHLSNKNRIKWLMIKRIFRGQPVIYRCHFEFHGNPNIDFPDPAVAESTFVANTGNDLKIKGNDRV